VSERPVQILCTGDLHLGRYPSRVPVRQREFSVEQVWQDLVSYAVQQDVDVVALTGDVVDNENATYESLGPLQKGLDRLDEAEIHTMAVSGNHDYDALPRLDHMVEASRFQLLGRGGRWDDAIVEPADATPVQFLGWSFRNAHEPSDPLETLPGEMVEEGLPTVGLLHAEVDAPESVYAPVRLEGLRQKPVAAWLLGHIHKPQVWKETSPPVLYPGSPQPLDPGETGAHGPWLVEVGSDGRVDTSPLPRATLRYDVVEINVHGEDDEQGVDEAITDALRQNLREALQSQPALRRLVCRLRITGRTSLHRDIGDVTGALVDGLELPVDEAVATVEKTEIRTRPDLDLDRIAEGSAPPAVLARLLLDIENREESDLAQDAWEEIERVRDRVLRSPPYDPLRKNGDEALEGENVEETVRRQGLLLLDELLGQTDDTANHE
jgi:DNA repair exonuclease SbcCD nuclease subunit